MKLLTNERRKSHENAKNCDIWKEKFEYEQTKDKKYCKVSDHCYYKEYTDASHSICDLKHSVPKEIAIVCHSSSNHDYNLIIKVLAEEFFYLTIYLFMRKH